MFINKKEIESIGNDIFKEIKNNGYSTILEEILITNTILTDSNTLQRRFDSNNINYNFSTLEDLEKIYGFKMEDVEGYDKLDSYYKELLDKHILKFINLRGLAYKIYHLPRKIVLEEKKNRFKIYTIEIDRFSYLDFGGDWY